MRSLSKPNLSTPRPPSSSLFRSRKKIARLPRWKNRSSGCFFKSVVRVKNGSIHFRPHLLRQVEFLADAGQFHYIDLADDRRQLPLAADSLAFSFCQVPIIYRLSQKPRIIFETHDNRAREIDGLEIDVDTSAAIFLRQHSISSIQVDLMPGR